MAAGDIVQQATPFAATINGNSFPLGCPAFSGAPIEGNTDILCCVSSSTVTTPTGYTRDTFDVSFAGIYIFRRTVLAGATGSAQEVALGASRPLWSARYELSGTAAVDVAATAKYYNSSGTTSRSSNALATTLTDGILFFATDDSSADQTWSTFSAPSGLTMIDHGVPSGGTSPYNGVSMYVNGVAAGTNTMGGLSTLNTTRYQILGVGYNFTAAGATSDSTAVIAGNFSTRDD